MNNFDTRIANASFSDEIQVQKVDWDDLAQKLGEVAYQTAKEDGCSEKTAQRFKEVFGAPIEPEFRF